MTFFCKDITVHFWYRIWKWLLNLILVSIPANPFDKKEICTDYEGLGRAEGGLVYILFFLEGQGQEYEGGGAFLPLTCKGRL